MSLSAQQLQAAEAALDDIERQRRAALAGVAVSWDMSGGSAQAAARAYLTDTVPQALESLRGPQLDRVDSGALSWEAWVQNATDVRNGIAYVAGDVSSWSFTGVLLSTGKQTAIDLGSAGNRALQGAGIGAGVFAFVVLAYVAWKVS